ncbi:MAG TPA: hypothetical protein VMJ93_18730 [Verrucomicrobiae bacterium]|nr:hypothetical protein [Verrucomicrobiae bacterium]
MQLLRKCASSLLLAVALAGPIVVGGCAEHASVRVYDPGYGDYHYWNSGEEVYYRQWINVTNRHYVKYQKLQPRDQQAYWNWRHEHMDHDHH